MAAFRLAQRSSLILSSVKKSSSSIQIGVYSSFHTGSTLNSSETSKTAPATAVDTKAPSFIEKTGLNDWKISAPIAAALAIPAISNGVYTLNEESQLACCFFLFVTSAYKLGGDMISSYFDSRANAILKEHNDIEDNNIALAQESLDLLKSNKGVLEDIQAMRNAFEEYVQLMEKVHTAKLRHDARTTFIKNLEFIVQKEANFKAELQTKMVEYATKKVNEDVIKGGKSVQENAFQSALNILNGKEEDPTKDVVKTLYIQHIKQYSKEISDLDGKVIKLTDEEVQDYQREIDAVVRNFNMTGVKVTIPKEYTVELPK